MAGVGKNSEARDLPSAETGGRQAAGVLWLGAQPAWALATRVKNALSSPGILPRNAGVRANEILLNQLTQKHRARSSGCSGRVPRPCGATEARRSDLARTKTCFPSLVYQFMLGKWFSEAAPQQNYYERGAWRHAEEFL